VGQEGVDCKNFPVYQKLDHKKVKLWFNPSFCFVELTRGLVTSTGAYQMMRRNVLAKHPLIYKYSPMASLTAQEEVKTKLRHGYTPTHIPKLGS